MGTPIVLQFALSLTGTVTINSGSTPLVPLAISDFENGIYSIGGVNKTLAEMWTEDLANWGPFDPTSVVAGVGFTQHSNSNVPLQQNPITTPELFAALVPVDNLTVVAEYFLASDDITIAKPSLDFTVTDFPGFTTEQDWGGGANASPASTSISIVVDDNTGIKAQEALPLGVGKSAFLIAQPSLAVSNNGNPAIVTAPVPPLVSPNVIALVNTVKSNGTLFATTTLRKLTFYSGQPIADLAALSA